MSKKIFVALSTFARYGEEPLNLLKESGMDYALNPLGRRLLKEEVPRLAKGCQGIVAGVEPYDADVLAALPDLRCISRCGVGVDNIDHQAAEKRGIIIRNTPQVVIQPVAELTIAMIFDLLRKLTWHTETLRRGTWEKRTGSLLWGKNVGILGLGRIGRHTAKTLNGLGANVYGADISVDRSWADQAGVQIVSVEELLRVSDVVTIHLAWDPDHAFVLGTKEIRLMKPGALLVNTSRGQFVDEAALYEALKERRLGGAALDVFSEEPYHGPLCRLDNVILTPHIATLTKESRLRMEQEAVSNLLEVLSTMGWKEKCK